LNTVFVLCLHSDTLEPYESYPQTELLCAFNHRPSKADLYKTLRKRFPNTSGMVQWVFGKENCWSNSLCLEPSEGDYYGSIFRFEVKEVESI
jgi:hypothetical protein